MSGSAASALLAVSVDPRRKRRPTVVPSETETEFHLLAARLLRLGMPHGAAFFFHVPNQGKRSPVVGAMFKGMGMVPGLTDLVLVIGAKPGEDAKVAFLELKRPDGTGRLRPDQVAFRDLCHALGVRWGEARTLAEVETFAREFLAAHGLQFRARA